jgi:hypothetical protein
MSPHSMSRYATREMAVQSLKVAGTGTLLSPEATEGASPCEQCGLAPRVSRDDYPLPLHLAPATVTEKDWVANKPPGSVARTVTPNDPRTVGVHLIRPVDELIVMPAGIGATRL